MKLTSIILVMLLSSCLAAQQKDSANITKTELSIFLNSFYDGSTFFKKLRFVNTPNSPLTLEYIKEHNLKYKIFTEEDLIFFESQIETFREITYDSSYIKNANFIDGKQFLSIFSSDSIINSKKDRWEIFNDEYGLGYTLTSYPLFTKNKKYCILYVEYSIGWMGGSGELRIYEKTNDKWKICETIALWDS